MAGKFSAKKEVILCFKIEMKTLEKSKIDGYHSSYEIERESKF